MLVVSSGLVLGSSPHPRGAQLFMQKGLQIEAWVMGSELFGGNPASPAADREIGRSNLWDSGFIPTFYQAPFFSADLMADPRSSEWSTAADRKFNFMPNTSDPALPPMVLTPEQDAQSAGLVSICFGDEEPWNTSRLPAWAAWADLAHEQVPHVIILTNQWLGQFSFKDYQDYLAAVNADLLSIDNYDFPGGMPAGAEPRNTSTVGLLTACCTVRDMAAHAPAPGLPPLPFGYYMQGFESKSGYQLSSAQIRAGYFLPLALGAKWLNMFRLMLVHATRSLAPLRRAPQTQPCP